MKMIAAALLALVSGFARAQDAPASAPAESFGAYRAAEECMRAYGRRFAPTSANPQDVADAGLQACHGQRWAAAVAKARRNGAQSDDVAARYANTEPDEVNLRRAAIMALLEARYPKR